MRRLTPFQRVVWLGRVLQRFGFSVSENPMFGGVHAVHASGSAHYLGDAIDVNDDRIDEAEALTVLARLLSTVRGVWVLWDVAGHYDHLHAQTVPLGFHE